MTEPTPSAFEGRMLAHRRILARLIAALPEAEAIGVAWRVFGSAGVKTWPGEQISSHFTRASRRQWPPNTQIKTLFRYDSRISWLHIHRPVFERSLPASGIAFYGSDGLRLPEDSIHRTISRGYPVHRLARSDAIHTLAQRCGLCLFGRNGRLERVDLGAQLLRLLLHLRLGHFELLLQLLQLLLRLLRVLN